MTPITKKYLINGPMNVVRLTNGKKVLYIFGDIHYPPNNQTECIFSDKQESLDINNFLLLFIKTNTNNIKYDLFIEGYQYELYENYPYYKDNYLTNTIKSFRNIENKYKNYKIHYTDIRLYLGLLNIIYNYSYDYIFNKRYTGRFYIILYTNLRKLISINIEELNKNSFIKKILNKYENTNIKKKINIFYKKYLLKNYKNIIKIIDKFIKFIKLHFYDIYFIINTIDLYNLNKSNYTKLEQKIITYSNKISNLCEFTDLVITDLYFIRRFLDKNYINNGILYTGHWHMCNIMVILIKFFNFKLTNIFHKQDFDIDKYIKKISFKNYEYIEELNNLLDFKLQPNNINYQCTNLFNFPDNFT